MRDYVITEDGAGLLEFPARVVRAEDPEEAALAAMRDVLGEGPNIKIAWFKRSDGRRGQRFRSVAWGKRSAHVYRIETGVPLGVFAGRESVRVNRRGQFVAWL